MTIPSSSGEHNDELAGRVKANGGAVSRCKQMGSKVGAAGRNPLAQMTVSTASPLSSRPRVTVLALTRPGLPTPCAN